MKLGHTVRRIVGWNAEPEVPLGVSVPLRSMHRGLLFAIVLFIPANLFVGWLKWLGYENDEQPLSFARYFDLGEEQNLPAWISTMLLMGAALSAVAASQQHRSDAVLRRGFKITAGALAYASLDEATYIHERASDPLREWLGVGGLLYWTWVLPALVVVAVLARLLWPFLWQLPAPVRRDIFLAAGLFLSCAVGLEMLDALVFSVNEEPGVITDLLTIVEECGEMLAVMFFIDTMVRHTAQTSAEQVEAADAAAPG